MRFNMAKIGGTTSWAARLVLGVSAMFALLGPLELRATAADNGLEGVWRVQVTLRDCATLAPAGPAIDSLVTFHTGGTLSEVPSSIAFAPGQRSVGHGTWSSAGRHSFDQRMVALFAFDTPANLPGTPSFNPALPVSPGFLSGWQTVTHRISLDDPSHITSTGTNEFYKGDGTLYRTGCSTAVGRRFE